jgi:hypothetical protein
MDYPVLNKSPNVAQAIVLHTIDGNGNAIAIGAGNGMTVQKASNSSTSGTLSAVGSVSTAAGGFSGGATQINGAPVGTFAFEQSVDGGTTWVAKSVHPVGGGGVAVTSVVNPPDGSVYKFAAGAMTNIRVRCSAYSSGTAAITIALTDGVELLALPLVTYAPKLINASATAMTRPANTTAYSAGDAVSNNATAGSVTPIGFTASDLADAPVALTHLELLSGDTGPGTAGATFEAWLFNIDPTANSGVGGGDNASFSQKQAGFIGRMQGTFIAASDGSVAVLTPVEGTFVATKPISGGTTIYALLKTLTAFTPSANSTTFTATLRGVQGRA